MILGEKFKSRSSILETYSLYFVIAWTFIVGGFLLFGIFQIRHIQQEMVKNEARANFNKDQALRFWSATHGGTDLGRSVVQGQAKESLLLKA
jgi:hypothetical protein